MANLTVHVAEGQPPMVVVSGEIDLSTAPVFERAIASLLSNGNHSVAIDMGDVSYLDSTGIGVVMEALKRCRECGGDLVIRGVSDRALRVMRLLSLDRVIRFYPNGAQVAI